MKQIQSLLEKFRGIANQQESCTFIHASQPRVVSCAGSLQECLPAQNFTTVSVNILTDLRIAPPPLTEGASAY
ncbi:hypothetical protein BH10CYA1_BH10CYA1_18550 [soil metagenome]